MLTLRMAHPFSALQNGLPASLLVVVTPLANAAEQEMGHRTRCIGLIAASPEVMSGLLRANPWQACRDSAHTGNQTSLSRREYLHVP
jgi:hypothetical protein